MKIRSVFLGGGINSASGRAHFSALNIDNHWDVRGGLFSRNVETQLSSLKSYNIADPLDFTSVSDLIENKHQYDVAHVLTPPSAHKNQIIDLVTAGINVVSEKPLVTSLDEALDLRNVINNNRGFLAVIYNYLGYPMIREMADRIRRGEIGLLHEIHVHMPQEGFVKLNNGEPILPQVWRQTDGVIPTVSLDLGVHVHMMIKYLTQLKPTMVYAKTGSNGNIEGLIDSVNAVTTYENDVIANIWYGKSYFGYRNGLEVKVFGREGSFSWKQVNPENIVMTNSSGEQSIIDRATNTSRIAALQRYERFKVGHPSGFVEALANYYYDIYGLIQNDFLRVDTDVPQVFGISESIEGLLWLDTLHKSAATGTNVALDYDRIR